MRARQFSGRADDDETKRARESNECCESIGMSCARSCWFSRVHAAREKPYVAAASYILAHVRPALAHMAGSTDAHECVVLRVR